MVWRCCWRSLLLSGCAAVPVNTVAEQLDEVTGTTVTRVERPIELVAIEPRGANSDPFAYLAPFETNRMGQRQLYLWVAIPDERSVAPAPTVLVGEQALVLTSIGGDAKSLSLGTFPYSKPAPWSAIHAYEIDGPTLRALAAATSFEVRVRYDGQQESRFTGAPKPADLLQKFVANLGL